MIQNQNILKRSLVVLISGNGSNLSAMIKYGLAKNIKAVISNNPEAKGLLIAKDAGIATHVINHMEYLSKNKFEAAMMQTINKYRPRFIILAGFMRILSANFVDQYANQIINIHPSLLPSFKGLHPQQQALNSGAKISGATIHLVDSEVDHGKIIAQAITYISSNDTVQTLSKRIHTLEHIMYPFIISKFLDNEVVIKERLEIEVHKSPQDAEILKDFYNYIFY
jgi:phosphoribosylglycinamide formyltransferase 1